MESKYPSRLERSEIGYLKVTQARPDVILSFPLPGMLLPHNHVAHSFTFFGASLKCYCISQGNKHKADGEGVLSSIQASRTQVLSIW